MGKIGFNQYEERDLLTIKPDDVYRMRSLYDHYLLYLFIQAGRFPPGQVRSTKVCEAFNQWLMDIGIPERVFSKHRMAHMLRRFPNVGTWREGCKSYAHLKSLEPNDAALARLGISPTA